MRAAVLCSLAGLLASVSSAAINTRLQYQASHDGVTWSSTLPALPGDTVQVRALVSYIGSASAPTAGGLGQLVFQPVLTNLSAADLWNVTPLGAIGPVGGTRSTPLGTVSDSPGVWGRITPFGANATRGSTYLRGFSHTVSGVNYLRIAQANITNWIGVGATSGSAAANNWSGGGGVSIAQISNPNRLSTDPVFNANTSNVVVFKFGIRVPVGNFPGTITISTPAEGIGRVTSAGSLYGTQNARWFASASEVSSSLVGGVEVVDGTIAILPAPGAVGVFGVAVLAALRRRR